MKIKFTRVYPGAWPFVVTAWDAICSDSDILRVNVPAEASSLV